MPDGPTWVFDTNVVVSGLLSAAGPPGRLVDMMLTQRLRMAVDDRIEAEYREVLGRPKFDILPERVEAFLAVLQFQWHVTAPPWPHPFPPDPDDACFLEVAGETAERVLVTGNLKHFPARCCGSVSVLAPQVAWHRLTR